MRGIFKKSGVMVSVSNHRGQRPLHSILRQAQDDTRVRFFTITALFFVLTSFSGEQTLQGTWTFVGSMFNGKYDGPPKDYTLQRIYTANTYDAYVLEAGQKPEKFESGKYKLVGDTCLETQTFSEQPSKLKGVTVHYAYILRHDSLILHAKLPNGFYEDDYWKKVK